MTVHRGPLKSVYAGHAALHSIVTVLILTLLHSLPVYSHMIRLSACLLSACLFLHYQALCLSILALSGSLPVYSHMIRLSACLFLHYQARDRLFSHCQAHCLSSLSLLGSYSLTIRLTACLLSLAGLLPIYSVTLVLIHSHIQTGCLSSGTLSCFIRALSNSLPSVLALSDLPTYSRT